MAQPTPYTRQANFSDLQNVSPANPLPAASVDAEFNAVKLTTDQVRVNLAKIQRDDGALANQSVGAEQLRTSIIAGVDTPTLWSIAPTNYSVGNTVAFIDTGAERSELWLVNTAHTSTPNFDVDAAAFMTQLATFNFSAFTAGAIPYSPGANGLGTNVQQAVDNLKALVDGNTAANTDLDAKTGPVQVFQTRALAAGATLRSGIELVVTFGGDIVGDLGAATYKVVETEPAHPGKIAFAGGKWGELCRPDSGEINEKMIGESGIGPAHDDSPLLEDTQAAAYALRANVLFVGPELYANVDIGVRNSNRVLTVRGLGPTYNGNGALGAYTRIRPFDDTKPCVAVNGARRIKIHDFGIVSNNSISFSTYTRTGVTPTTQAYQDLIFGARSSKTPRTGIAIDPYALLPDGSAPSDVYAGETYHTFKSSDVELERIEIHGFPLAVGVQTSGADGNGDFPSMSKISISNCRDGIGVGNSQCRNVHADRIIFANVDKCLVSNFYGAATGRIVGLFSNCSGGSYIGMIADLQGTATPGPIVWDACYWESLHQLMRLTGNVPSGESGIKFESNTFNFRWQGQDCTPPTAIVSKNLSGTFVNNKGLKIFDNCKFVGVPEIMSMVSENVLFKNGSVVFSTDTTETDILTATRGLVTSDIASPLPQQEIFDGQELVTQNPSPVVDPATITIVSVVGDVVTYTGHGNFGTHPAGSIIRDRIDGSVMKVTGDGTARLMNNLSGGAILEPFGATVNCDFIAIP